MISSIHCGSEKSVYRFPSGSKLADAWKWKRVYRFPSGNRLADARKKVTSYRVHSDSLIKNLTSFEDEGKIRLLNFLM